MKIRRNKVIKYLLVCLVLIFIMSSLMAVNPWKARFRVINQTGKDIYIILTPEDEDGQYYTQLVVPAFAIDPEDEEAKKAIESSKEAYMTMFTIVRGKYEAQVHACGYIAEGKMDLTTNLKLNFTECRSMKDPYSKKYHGEPTMEKPNWFLAPGLKSFRFIYDVPPVKAWDYEEFFPTKSN